MSLLKRLYASPYLLLTLTILFWAGNTTFARGFRDAIPPGSLSFWRWTIALLVLLPLGGRAAWAGRHEIAKEWPRFAALAVLSVTTYNTALYYGLHFTTAINASLVAASTPIATVALSWLMLRRKLSPVQALGIVLSTFGVAVLIGHGELDNLAGLEFNIGDLAILFAMVTWALYSVMLEQRRPALSSLGLLTALVAVGVAFIFPFYAWELAHGQFFDPTPANLGVIFYTGVFPSVVAYMFWNRGIELVGANTTGQFIYLTPAAGTAMAIVFLGEAFHLYHAGGIALVLVGVWLATRRKFRNG